MSLRNVTIFLFFCLFFLTTTFAQDQYQCYDSIQKKLAKGWNTWSYGSMLHHIFLPAGLGVKINLRQDFIGSPFDPNYLLDELTIDHSGMVRPVAHSFDGSYTELIIENWMGNFIRIQSAATGNDLIVLITPIIQSSTKFFIEVESGFMWNATGSILRKDHSIEATNGADKFVIHSTATPVERDRPYQNPYLIVRNDSAVAIYVGAKKSIDEIKTIIVEAERNYSSHAELYGDKADAFKALQSVLGWNTLYDAQLKRVITPVSRGWNEAWQGYVLFEWDTYFTSLLFSLENKELAYSNVIAVTKPAADGHVGFWQMPGYEAVQSQPPVGGLVTWLLYERYHERWFLEHVYAKLLDWNRWWPKHRSNDEYLTWGAPWKNATPHQIALESGLDNSPMYDEPTIREKEGTSLYNLADVGLNSLYVADCKYLARIAEELGKKDDRKELLARAASYSRLVQSLWVEEQGIFLNKYLDQEKFSKRLSPTLFYPMLAGIATPRQAKRMIAEHFLNTNEFFGDFILPSIAFNDSSYTNQYWQGSIWPPMNFLVYLGLRDYDKQAAKVLSDKSFSLFTEAWKRHHFVFENINSQKGVLRVEDQLNSDRFYTWGALMALMKFMEDKKR